MNKMTCNVSSGERRTKRVVSEGCKEDKQGYTEVKRKVYSWSSRARDLTYVSLFFY
jgi:hypothetical protein